MKTIAVENNTGRMHQMYEETAEMAILVGIEASHSRVVNGKSEGERLLDELEELSRTAGVTVLQKMLQRKTVRDPAFFLGRGKVEELGQLCRTLEANLIIFDDELSGAQVRNIEEVTDVRVIDRTTLILDIFAHRAHSIEGKLQVELAQLKYRLPRLIGLGGQLSRLGGGIGTRGPGEKKLEVDRRHIKRRIRFLEKELLEVASRRNLIRERRRRNEIPTIAIVGYTNAGKSTLLNVLSGANVFTEDRLFATLDPTTRRIQLPDGREALLIDTVGFIRKLPHELIDAFKSTLEEALYADMLLHVADISSVELDEHIGVVNGMLEELGASQKPVILVLNKADLAGEEARIPVKDYGMKAFEISALTGQGLGPLLDGIALSLPAGEVEVEILVPYGEGWVIPYVHDNGKVIEKEFTESGTKIKAVINRVKFRKISRYSI